MLRSNKPRGRLLEVLLYCDGLQKSPILEAHPRPQISIQLESESRLDSGVIPDLR